MLEKIDYENIIDEFAFKRLEEVILNDDLILFIVGVFDTFYCWCIVTVEAGL